MKTILVASSKGGAGKTTLATNLAAYFALDGKRTVLYPQLALPFETPVVVSLNPFTEPARDKLIRRIEYAHPVFDQAAIDAHMATPHLKAVVTNTQPLLAEPLDVRFYTLA